MTYLLDTNIWLERLLDQKRSDQVGEFFREISAHNLHLTDFSLHSIGVVTERLNRNEVFEKFVEDLFEENTVNLTRLKSSEIKGVIQYIEQYTMDFDDAYQYTVATKYDLEIISFDSDFDDTDKGRQLPSELIKFD